MRLEQAYDPLRSVQAAWDLLRRTPLTVLVGALLPVVAQWAIFGALQFCLPIFALAGALSKPPEIERVFPLFAAIAGTFGIVFFTFQCWIDVGFARAIERCLATGTEAARLLFGGADGLGHMMLAKILTGLAMIPAFLPLLILLPVGLVIGTMQLAVGWKLLAVGFAFAVSGCLMVFLALGFALAGPIVALERCTAGAALARSWRLARGRRWRLLWFFVFLGLLGFAGMLLCGIGMLMAVPLIQAMQVEAYVALTHDSESRR
jgi:hypothetical protein